MIGTTDPPSQFCNAASGRPDRKSTRLNSSHSQISYAVFCLKKKKKKRVFHRHGLKSIHGLDELPIRNSRTQTHHALWIQSIDTSWLSVCCLIYARIDAADVC